MIAGKTHIITFIRKLHEFSLRSCNTIETIAQEHGTNWIARLIIIIKRNADDS